MNGPTCYECHAKPAIDLSEETPIIYTGVIFCSMACAARYGIGMWRIGNLRWCYWCRCWRTYGARSACMQCGFTVPEGANRNRARGGF